MRIRFLLLAALVLAASPALGAGWLEGDQCDGTTPAASTSVGTVVYCPNVTNGITSPVLVNPTGAVCEWDDSGSSASVVLIGAYSGTEFRTMSADTVCDPGVADCSIAGIYPGQAFYATASATCATCKLVCGRMH